MRAYWPKDENVMSWDPENMDKYWAMCQKYDRYPEVDAETADGESQQAFANRGSRNRLNKES